MKFLGIIDTVVPDHKNDEVHHRRFYMKLVAYDELLQPQSVYVRIQGRNADKVLAMMDDATGEVHGLWQAELAVNVVEYPSKDRTIYANLVHCTRLDLVDPDFPDGGITDADRTLAAEIIPVAVDGKETPCVLQRKRTASNWLKTILS